MGGIELGLPQKNLVFLSVLNALEAVQNYIINAFENKKSCHKDTKNTKFY